MAVCFKERLVFELASFDGDMFMVDRDVKILNFGFSKFIDNDFADLFLFFVYRQLFFSQIKTFFLGVFRASNLRRIGPIIPYGMVEIRASARMFLILIAVFIFRV